MRFRVTLSCQHPQEIPLSYQYPLSAWIYKVFSRADAHFANWLHEHGHAFNGNRKFKLFTFSWLTTPRAKMLRGTSALRVMPGDNYFFVSFHIGEAASHFIAGLFQDQELIIAGPQAKGYFAISKVERMPEPSFKDGAAYFECLSPVNVTKPVMANGKLRAVYLDPQEPEYAELLHANILKRYAAAHRRLVGMLEEDNTYEALAEFPFDSNHWNFQLKGKPLKRAQRIKEGRPQETTVIGYSYPFRLEAPEELLHFIWNAGLGEKGSLGFGCVGNTRAAIRY